MASLFVTSNPVFCKYALSAAVLAVKMISMAFLTVRHRLNKNVFTNPEDAAIKNVKVSTDPDVERVRRAHRNDLENIPAFWIIGLLFVLTEPSALTAKICFYGFTAARIVHSFCYLNEHFPFRGLSYLTGTLINLFMAGSVILRFI